MIDLEIMNLDDKFLEKIFSNLSVVDKVKCKQVCKRWNEMIKFEELCVYYSRPFDRSINVNVAITQKACLDKLLFLLIDLKKLVLNLHSSIIYRPRIDLSNLDNLVHFEIDYYLKDNWMLEHLMRYKIQLHKLKYLNIYVADLEKLARVFPNLTHLKTVIVESTAVEFDFEMKLKYFEQYDTRFVNRYLVDFLARKCPQLEYLAMSTETTTKLPWLIGRLIQLNELNLNITNNRLKICMKNLPRIYKAMSDRDIKLRINGLILKDRVFRDNDVPFRIHNKELYAITYEGLELSNNFTQIFEKEDIKYYYNNFRKVEITEETYQFVKPFYLFDLIMKRVKKLTYEFKNQNSAEYFFTRFFQRLPNVENLLLLNIKNHMADLLNKLPVLFQKVTFLQLYADDSLDFPLEFISGFSYLQTLLIKSNEKLVEKANLHLIIKNLKYLNYIKVDPVYPELIPVLNARSMEHSEIFCHIHPLTEYVDEDGILHKTMCIAPHNEYNDFCFESFNDHNNQIEFDYST